MKRLFQVAAVAAISVFMPVAVGTPASAAFKCEIGYTASGSDNMCISEDDYSCEITNNNSVVINDSTEQEAATGSAETSGNGTGGDASSGVATNSSGTTYNFTITNGGSSESEEDGRVCMAKKIVPATEIDTPETPETPVTPDTPTPGRGGASGAMVQPAQEVTPSALPVTSGDTAPVVVLAGSTALTLGLAAAYRRLYV